MDEQRIREIAERLLPFDSIGAGNPAQWVRLSLPPDGYGEIQLERSTVMTRAEAEAELAAMDEYDRLRTIIVPPGISYWPIVQEFAKANLEKLKVFERAYCHGG